MDDLFTVGNGLHRQQMDKLRAKYTFGKYVKLEEEKNGAGFNGRRVVQHADGGFEIDMKKFVEERLHPIELEKGRRAMRKEKATEAEVAKMRATCGALNWLAKEGRPDAAGPSSILSSRLTSLTVEDIIHANEVVKALKLESGLSIKIQPLVEMKLSIVTDASFANNGYHSQGGQILIAHEKGLRDGVQVKTNVLAWRSGKLQRVVNSTLAAETQSLSRGLGDLIWTMVLVQEMCDARFSIKNWRKKVGAEEVLIMASNQTEEALKGSLAIVDAKSLYDYLSKETVGGSDRRTALEIQIIREDLMMLDGQVRWIDHPAMVADSLTKIKGNHGPLHSLLKSGKFRIQSEDVQMSKREVAREQGQTSCQIRRSGVKEKPGNCEMQSHGHVKIDS